MSKAGFDVIVGSFEKRGTIYHAAITTPKHFTNEKTLTCEFKVLLSHPERRTLSFKIKKHDCGNWIPDKRQQVDPWIADNIGNIIEKKMNRIPG